MSSGTREVQANGGRCVGPGCHNERTPGDWRQMCPECNPFGDSLVMNSDPSYLSWAARSDHW